MNTTCPSCGRPIRPGTKFCGNCGATIPGIPAVKPPASVSPPAAVSGPACPNCGKPIRPESRFCPHCGRTLTPVGAPPATPPPGALKPVSPPPQPADRVSAHPTPAPVQQAKPAPVPPQPVKGKPEQKKRPGTFWLLVGGAGVLVVVFAAFAVWMLSKAGVFGEATETPTASETALATDTLTIEPTLTDTLAPSASATFTPLPTSTSTESPAPTATSTETPGSDVAILPSATITPPTGGPSPSEPPVLSETFSSPDLTANWTIWGTSYSIIDGQFVLKGLTPRDTGLLSKRDFLASESTIIQFEATLTGTSPNDMILFNWDRKAMKRNAASPAGPIHIQIGGEQSKMVVGFNELLLPSPDTHTHLYAIEVLSDGSLAFYFDGKKMGKLLLPGLPVNGSFSFSGTGRIDNIKVFTPTAIIGPTTTSTNKPRPPTETPTGGSPG